MTPWELPQTAVVGGTEYQIDADYRNILTILGYLEDPDKPEWLRWQIALGLFYGGEIPAEHQLEAMEHLSAFISYGDTDKTPGPKLMDWEQDARMILADINKVAGAEIRALPYLHWWTFLSYFRAVGEGQLSTVVSIRNKLATGKKLEKWEQEYCEKNRDQVVLKKKYSAEELAEMERLKALLDG